MIHKKNKMIKVSKIFSKKVGKVCVFITCLVIALGLVRFIMTADIKEVETQEFVLETNYTEFDVYIENLTDEFRKTRSDLRVEVDSFIKTQSPNSNLEAWFIIDECIRGEYFDIILLLSQGLKESHFGTFGLANKTNSVFNVGAYDKLTYAQIDKKFDYKNPNNSIRPYIDLMNKKYLLDKLPSDLLENFVNVNGSRYATYEYYERDLKRIYDNIQKTTSIEYKYNKLIKLHKKLSSVK